VEVFIGHKAENVANADLFIYTASIAADNPELVYARETGIPTMDRGTLLGQIMQGYTNGISVAGTHGKTTTTAMISTIFELLNTDPTIHIGGVLPLIGGSIKPGGKDYFITEACEYVESFLKLFPTCIVLLNIDKDHMDYFRDLEHIISSFGCFADLLPEDGYLLGHGDDHNVRRVLAGRRYETFGLAEGNTWVAKNLTYDREGYTSFEIYREGSFMARVKYPLLGEHNCLHALAAVAVACHYGLDAQQAADALAEFRGADRRFQFKGMLNGARVIHDYAHHPSEIASTLANVRLMAPEKVWCVFQPHTYTRTKALFDEFVHAFDQADRLILTEIYSAREPFDPTVSSEMLSDAIAARGRDSVCIAAMEEIAQMLKEQVGPGEVVLTMGAGSINQLDDLLLN
jgi:UDP-N-acetylmuramate--alanine ligase